MVIKSHGLRRGTRTLFRRVTKMTVNQYMKEFKEGERVAIKIESASQSGMPFRRFYGLTGIIAGKRGRAYIVKIKDGNKPKTVISKPEHLKKI